MSDLWITLGPSSLERLDDLIIAGVGGVRLTFSFGTPHLQEERAQMVTAAAERAGSACLAIADLAGEKIRLGQFSGPVSVSVDVGQLSSIVTAAQENPAETGRFPLPNPAFITALRKGQTLIIGDGSAVAKVESCDGGQAVVRWERAGVVNQSRGVILQDGSFMPACLTATDKEQLRFVAKAGTFDAVALSFVSSADDVRSARAILREHGADIPIIAKIETLAGVHDLDRICAVSDTVMAARGDLALCAPWSELPEYVELIADAAGRAAIPWILATQVAEGLERFAMPTRAEICDLAHWLKRGCSAVLLSYETVFGNNPAEAVACTKTLLSRYGRSD